MNFLVSPGCQKIDYFRFNVVIHSFHAKPKGRNIWLYYVNHEIGTPDGQSSLFSMIFQTFALGQTNWANKFWGIWAKLTLLFWLCEFFVCGKMNLVIFPTKTFVFRPNTYTIVASSNTFRSTPPGCWKVCYRHPNLRNRFHFKIWCKKWQSYLLWVSQDIPVQLPRDPPNKATCHNSMM